METLTFKCMGVAPLLMHNGQLADPLNKWTKLISEISSKRGKTESDLAEMARLEFLGGLYLNDNGPCVPAEIVEASLFSRGGAARKHRMGKQAQAALFCPRNFDLIYEGSRDPLELWAAGDGNIDRRGVNVQTSKVMRTRPIFKQWAAIVEVCFDPNIIDGKEVEKWMFTAGAEVGWMDWRPRYGRFNVENL